MSKTKKNNKSLLNEGGQSQNRVDIGIFMTILWYCVLIIFLPIVSFFASKYVLEGFDLTSVSKNIYAAVIAVINLHIALGLYLFKAYSGGDPPKQTLQKQD
ncbi:vacuolar ATPase assembly integral membrane protein VMA21 homolog [Chironomus tepperi]|uniref:vacuolar ATPase assembly integral membrane protein VMA21 homolog n=1 Tax=Chironomus tepperi TaxID=113505 RepID=UPI00391F1486